MDTTKLFETARITIKNLERRQPTFAEVTGAILGTAMGDGLGAPVEFMRGSQLDVALVKHLAALDGGGQIRYTDDTQLTIAVIEGLLKSPYGDLDYAGAEVARQIAAWGLSPENNRAPGRACLQGAAQLRNGTPWRVAGGADARGCGAAMRSAPYGIFYWHSHKEAGMWAATHARITHRHPAAMESASIVAEVTVLILQHAGQAAILDCLREPGLNHTETRVGCLAAIETTEPTRALLNRLQGRTGDTAVAAALHCYFRYPDPLAALTAAVTHDGDSDSVGAIVGAWVGAACGYTNLPWFWEDVENADYLFQLATQVSAMLRLTK